MKAQVRVTPLIVLVAASSAIAAAALLAVENPDFGIQSPESRRQGDGEERLTNSIGMELVRIEPGSFSMGETNEIPVEMRKDIEYSTHGDWDEHPVHRVTITTPYYMSATEVTVQQYRAFKKDFSVRDARARYVSAISWYEAQEFCEWLSRQEGRHYRLPTEAEWEFAARAGTTTLFSSGDRPPAPESANAWGLKNMHTGVAEWVLDWHAPYPTDHQSDPIGPAAGYAKVIRGGGLDRPTPYYARSANRASYAPRFPPPAARDAQRSLLESETADGPIVQQQAKPELYGDFIRDTLNNQGNHAIGFRIVMAPRPEAAPTPVAAPFFQRAVKQRVDLAQHGPRLDHPYFRKRRLLPIPPENTPEEQLAAHRIAGLHPSMLRHQHSPGLTVAPNGDVIAVYFTSVSETTPDVALIATRLRFGSDAWDMPSLLFDFADANDASPMLWRDGKVLRLFWGSSQLSSGFPFQWSSSDDNGATWSEVAFPVFTTRVGGHSAQPITSAFRDRDDTMFVGSDGVGAESLLWVSRDGGRTWSDPGGRTNGRHTAFVLLEDNRILGMGGKNSDIDGFMPQSISSDGGRTWTTSKTPFPMLGANQRPTIVRLASGRLFFAGDLQDRHGKQPVGIHERGAYVALSDDEGETWHMKRLPGAEAHESPERAQDLGGSTLGYAVARQARNGLIHLITSMNAQALHFTFNEAWLLAPARATGDDEVPTEAPQPAVGDVRTYEERDTNGRLRARWSAGIAADGRYLLHGTETWYYPSGRKQWTASYEAGRKVGSETFWREDGRPLWTWDHRKDGTHVWTRYWPNGQKRTESIWRNQRADGAATAWDESGKVVGHARFVDGKPKK